MNKNSKIGLIFLAGAAAGAIAGILLAPDKGSDTRRKMADKARKFGDTVKEKANEGWQFANNRKTKANKEFVD